LKKSFIAMFATLSMGLFANSGTASAVSCSSLGSIDASSSFSCDFSESNVTQLDDAFIITVNYNSTNQQITLTAVDNNLSDGLTLSGFGFDIFGFNANGATITDQTISSNSWVTGGGCNGNLDGQGTMPDCLLQSGGGTTPSGAIYQLTGIPSSFDVNSNGSHFGVHYKTNLSGCTGFAGDLDVATTSNAECGTGGGPGGAATTATSVPEPSTFLMLGSGLLVLARSVRKKRG
jgi:PEP-CTERM motif-containing protein